MPEMPFLATFVVAVLAMQTMPGPDMVMVIARGVGQGRRIALCCVGGFAAAGLIQVPALALGVATLFQTSALSYAALQYAGAAYLIYVGVRFLLDSSKPPTTFGGDPRSGWSAFYQGFWNNLLNPKVLVFMLALLPQFVDPGRGSVAVQLAILGLTMKACGFLVNGAVAMLSGAAGDRLSRYQHLFRWQQRLVGSVLVALGLRLLFGEQQRVTM
ncbi:MAG: LysE family translocator [Proteobacteria bacterium]|nr:MAG: LysE family translocator [Pseudomonadota bacterium]